MASSDEKMQQDLTTLFTGRQRIALRTVGSTNEYLAGLQRANPQPEGTVVSAQFQESGKGQAGSKWESAYGQNMLVSILFYPSFLPAGNLFSLNMAFSLGLAGFAKELLGEHVRIKWPNDLYYLDKKLGGMLIENVVSAQTVSQTILGAGINLNQDSFSQHLPNPISFKQILKKQLDLDAAFSSLFRHVEARYLQLRRGEENAIREEYHRAMFRFGEWARYESAGWVFEGKIRGVSQEGKLMIEHRNGFVESFEMKEVRFRSGT